MTHTSGFTKLMMVSITLGFISPSIHIQKTTESLSLSMIDISIMQTAQAREEGRNRNNNNNKNTNRNNNRNNNKNTNRNLNINSNKNTNVNVNVNHNTNRNNRRVRPLAVLAGMAIGSIIVASAMSPSCTTVIVNGSTYKKCDGTYFQQSGPDYIVVKAP